jgi:hypothetical protein
MSESDASLAQVDQLLQQRAQYEQWLAKLTGAGSRAPEAVRTKVRADYESRLNGVVDELRKHASAVEGALSGHRQSLAELEARRADIEERLAEAEIRHSVGEYSEDEWGAVGSEAESALAEIGRRAGHEEGEINRLADVLQLIARPVGAQAAPSTPTPLPTPAVVDQASSTEPALGAPRFVPKTPGQMRAASPPPRKESPLDELDFLKSVTGEQSAVRRGGPTPRKGDSGSMRAINVGGEGGEAGEGGDVSGTPSAAAATGTATKTLKCGECGTLNRPTEWYCERCGAELAAL